jgi:ribosome recycling factor
LHEAKANNKSLFEETMEDRILKEIKKDEIADDKWLDNHRRKAIQEATKEFIKMIDKVFAKYEPDETDEGTRTILDYTINKIKEELKQKLEKK